MLGKTAAAAALLTTALLLIAFPLHAAVEKVLVGEDFGHVL